MELNKNRGIKCLKRGIRNIPSNVLDGMYCMYLIMNQNKIGMEWNSYKMEFRHG
jgi:hypothetical protein